VPMWLTGRGELLFSFVGQESTCDCSNTWTRSKHLIFFNRVWYECVYRKSWPGTPPACPRPALLLTGEDKDKKRERELSSHVPNITFRPRVNYMATMKSTSPPSPIISITETAVKQHMKHLSWIIVSRPRPS